MDQEDPNQVKLTIFYFLYGAQLGSNKQDVIFFMLRF